MTKLEGMTKFKITRDSSFVIHASSLIRHSSFACHAEAMRRRVIRHF